MGGKKYNDYGYGFYCTEYPDIGREWAVTTEHDGYCADDSCFSFAQDFINNVIPLEQLKKAMHLGNLGNQIVLKSKRAYERLEFIISEFVDKNLWLSKRMDRDERARKSYFEMNRSSYVKNAVYITTIIDKEMKADDPRIQ